MNPSDDDGPGATEDENGEGPSVSGQKDEASRWPVESIVQNVLLIVVVLVMIWLAFNVRLPSLEALRAQIDGFGWWGWLVFVGAYAVVAVTPIPITIMAVTGGVLFGVIEGAVLSVIGVMIGCWGAYWIARGVGRKPVHRLLGNHAATVEKNLDHGGFAAVFTLRVLPGLPYWPVNYGAGAFGVPQREFMLASIAACIPGQISLVSIGAFLSEPRLAEGIVLVSSWVVVIIMTIGGYRALRGSRSAEGGEGRIRGRRST